MDAKRRRFLTASLLCGANLAVTDWTKSLAAPASTGAAAASVPLPWDIGPGKKFGLDGRAQPWAGNTVICPINATNPAFEVLSRAYDELRPHAAHALSWLPSSSWHSTIFDGAADTDRVPAAWPQAVPRDASMEICDRYVGEAIRRMPPSITPPIRLKVDADPSNELRTVLFLKPIDDAENRRIRHLRDELARATGIRRDSHEQYRFHTSFAYYVRPFSPEGRLAYQRAYAAMTQHLNEILPVIELGVPEYAVFKDMLAYQLQFPIPATSS